MNTVETLGFNLVCQLHASGCNYASFLEDMHYIGSDKIQKMFIVSNDYGRFFWRAEGVHSVGDNFQGIHVQPAVGFVKNAEK